MYWGLFQTGYSVVSACVVSLRWKDKIPDRASTRWISKRTEGIINLLAIACCGFAAGALFRFGASFVFLIVATVMAIFSAAALYLRQVSQNVWILNFIFHGTVCFCVCVYLRGKENLEFLNSCSAF